MTNNHLILYHLAELMLEKEQHILPVDELFEDNQIGGFVRSINIDSPYQQLLFEGVLTETIKKGQVMVSFTVEGYFHYVLGEVIYNHAKGKEPEFLKNIIENNQLKGAIEGVENCLFKDIDNNDYSRLMDLIDAGDLYNELCTYPLANSILKLPLKEKNSDSTNIELERHLLHLLDSLFSNPTENDFKVLISVCTELEKYYKRDYTYLLVNLILDKRRKHIKDAPYYIYFTLLDFTSSKHRKELLTKLESELERQNESEKTNKDIKKLGNYFRKNGEPKKAIECYLKVYSTFQKSPYFINCLAAAYNLNNQNIEAKKHYERAYELIKNKGTCNYKSFEGQLLYNLAIIEDDSAKEYDYLLKAIEIDEVTSGKYSLSYTQTLTAIANNQLKRGETTKSKQNFKNVLKIQTQILGEKSEELAYTYDSYATSLSDLEEYEQAIEYFLKSFNIRKELYGWSYKTYELLKSLGYYMSRNNDYARLESIYTEAVNNLSKTTPKTSYLLCGLAWTKLIKEDYKAAINIIDKGIKDIDDSWQTASIEKTYWTDLYYYKAEALFEVGNYDESIKLLNLWLENPGDKTNIQDAYWFLGYANYYSGKYEDAIEYFSNFMANSVELKDESLKDITYYLAELNYRIKDYDTAINYFEKYIEVGDISRFTHLNYYVGFSYYFSRNYTKAIPYLETYSKQLGDTELFYFIGYCYSQIREHQKTIDNIKVYLNNDNELVHKESSLFLLGRAHFDLNQFQNSIKEFKALLIITKDKLNKSRNNYYLGANYFRLEKLDECKKYVNKSIKVDNNLDNNWLLAQCERKLENTENAIQHYIEWSKIANDKFNKTQLKKLKDKASFIMSYISKHNKNVELPNWIKELNDQ